MLCVSCIKHIEPVSLTLLSHPSGSTPVYACGAYKTVLKKLIRLKHVSARYASVSLAHVCLDAIAKQNILFDYVMFVPCHYRRYAERGFNQSEVMARYISAHTDKPMVHLLKKIKHTPCQSSLSYKERSVSVKDAFAYIGVHDIPADSSILIVDDVYTTGSTLKSMLSVLHTHTSCSYKILVSGRTIR
jgi:competence protein ComFC